MNYNSIPSLRKHYLTWIRRLSEQWWVITLLCASALLACILLTNLFTKPVADDFARLTQVRDMGLLRYWHFHITQVDGRYSNALFLGIVISIFGSFAVPMTLIITVLCLAAASWALLQSTTPKASNAAIYGTISVFIATVLLSAPSIFDSAFWMNAESIYTIALASIAATLALGLYTARNARLRSIPFLGLLVGVFICSGFNEIAPTISLLGLSVIFLKLRPHSRQQALRLAAIASTQLGALLIMWAAPGANARKALLVSYNKLSLFAAFRASVHHFFVFFASLGRAEVLLIAAAGIVLGYCAFIGLGKARVLKAADLGLSALCAAYCIFVPIFIVTYAGSTRFDGLPPYRAQIFSTTVLCLFVGFVVYYLLNRIHTLRQPALQIVPFGALAIMVVTGLYLSFVTLAAVTQRYASYSQRDTIVRAQMSLGDNSIHAMQVPVYLSKTEAADLPANNDPASSTFWVIDWFGKYYNAKQVTIDNAANLATCPATHIDWYVNGAYCKQMLDNSTLYYPNR